MKKKLGHSRVRHTNFVDIGGRDVSTSSKNGVQIEQLNNNLNKQYVTIKRAYPVIILLAPSFVDCVIKHLNESADAIWD